MTKDETQKLFVLLRQFYPAAERKKDSAFRAAWGMALEKYRYDDVRDAAVAYAQRSKYFPDLADLTASLVSVDDGAQRKRDYAWMRPYLDPAYVSPHHAAYEYSALHGVEVARALAALGLPPLREGADR